MVTRATVATPSCVVRRAVPTGSAVAAGSRNRSAEPAAESRISRSGLPSGRLASTAGRSAAQCTAMRSPTVEPASAPSASSINARPR
ncbi:MAG: hypothetical protein DMF78_05500 [Acidobacteria bacterium]|nr:MAG: hypothetical protein DMF78_05500 [Acidobacteriota bacterium]